MYLFREVRVDPDDVRGETLVQGVLHTDYERFPLLSCPRFSPSQATLLVSSGPPQRPSSVPQL